VGAGRASLSSCRPETPSIEDEDGLGADFETSGPYFLKADLHDTLSPATKVSSLMRAKVPSPTARPFKARIHGLPASAPLAVAGDVGIDPCCPSVIWAAVNARIRASRSVAARANRGCSQGEPFIGFDRISTHEAAIAEGSSEGQLRAGMVLVGSQLEPADDPPSCAPEHQTQFVLGGSVARAAALPYHSTPGYSRHELRTQRRVGLSLGLPALGGFFDPDEPGQIGDLAGKQRQGRANAKPKASGLASGCHSTCVACP